MREAELGEGTSFESQIAALISKRSKGKQHMHPRLHGQVEPEKLIWAVVVSKDCADARVYMKNGPDIAQIGLTGWYNAVLAAGQKGIIAVEYAGPCQKKDKSGHLTKGQLNDLRARSLQLADALKDLGRTASFPSLRPTP